MHDRPSIADPTSRGARRARAVASLAAALLALTGASAPSLAADDFTEHEAHEHGKATLDVAVDGGTVTLRLAAPAADIAGFEHRPRTDAERVAADAAIVVLKQHRTLFAFPVGARCAFAGVNVTPPTWGKSERDQAPVVEPGGDHGGDRHESAHADYVVQWRFTCAAPAALTFMDVKVPERFRKGLVVEANVITSSLQTRQTLRAGALRVKLQ